MRPRLKKNQDVGLRRRVLQDTGMLSWVYDLLQNLQNCRVRCRGCAENSYPQLGIFTRVYPDAG